MNRKRLFAADQSLGKLCKWLRILGFDTSYERHLSPARSLALSGEGRCLLTRFTALKHLVQSGDAIFIQANHPFEQLKQVIDAAGISAADIHPFSRCIRCNQPVSPVDKAPARHLVPDYVWETAKRISQCPECRRFYWPGSHKDRIDGTIRQLFADYNDDKR